MPHPSDYEAMNSMLEQNMNRFDNRERRSREVDAKIQTMDAKVDQHQVQATVSIRNLQA